MCYKDRVGDAKDKQFSVAGLGELRNNNDASCSYEGENNVLIQQTSNWLLSVRKVGYHSFQKVSPLGSAEFLSNFDQVINSKFAFKTSEEALRPESMITEENKNYNTNGYEIRFH